MLKISFVVLFICCLAVTQINAKVWEMCPSTDRLEGCSCIRELVLDSERELEWCPPRYDKKDDGRCVRTFRSSVQCEPFKSPTMGFTGCACV